MTDLSLLSRDELVERIHELERWGDGQAASCQGKAPLLFSHSLYELSRRIAHDIKAPLRQITQLSEILSESPKGVQDQDNLAVIDMIAGRATELDTRLEELRSFGNVHFQPMKYELVSIEEIVETCRLRLQLDDSQVHFIGAPDLLVKADRNLLDLFFHNLLAFLFLSSGMVPSVQIRQVSDEASNQGKILDISVSGYAFEIRGKSGFLDPYTSITANETELNTGLKMTICAMACKRHGWRLCDDFSAQEGFLLSLHA